MGNDDQSRVQPNKPVGAARVRPLSPDDLHDKGVTTSALFHAAYTWGQGFAFHNNLIRVMAHCPRLAQTEVDYANSFIFDEDSWLNGVQQAGFLDRLLKEIVITCVALENRARYSVTHHSYISFVTFKTAGRESEYIPKFIDLHLSLTEFQTRYAKSNAPYTRLEYEVICYTKKICHDPHEINDGEVESLRTLFAEDNSRSKRSDWKGTELTGAHMRELVDSQLVELTWIAAHFCLLGKWFIALHVEDEGDSDPVKFIKVYAETVPAQIIERNNHLLGNQF